MADNELAKRLQEERAELARRLQGRTPEEKKIIKYLWAPDGCLSKNITDEEYDQAVQAKYASLNLKQKALDKTGVDESQVNEIPPCEFKSWHYERDKNGKSLVRIKRGKDGQYRTSAYQGTWLLFSNEQVYVYQYTFNMDGDSKKERTEEYFYKDITNFSTTAEDEETLTSSGCLNKIQRDVAHYDLFQLIVPGDRFLCDLSSIAEAEEKIQAMKAKLREKKG
jgi:hypothetical protein